MSAPSPSHSLNILAADSAIGPYRVVRKLGQGGMGVVYEALHQGLGRRVAIKLLRSDLAADKELAARFVNEARTVNRVEHPGVVQVVDLGEQPSGEPYIVMEFLRGETLADRLKQRGGTLPWPEAVNILLQVAEVLVSAHQAGIVHRDLKPENIMLVEDPQLPSGQRVKLLDFGIAKILDEVNASHFRTKTGSLMGSPAYMSPEQCKGSERVTVQADIYALGVVMYELLAGAMPHAADGPGHMVVLHMFGTPRPLREQRRGLPEALYALVDSLLQKVPEQRPPIEDVVRALRHLQQSATGGAGRGRTWLLLGAALSLAGLLGGSLLSKVRTGRYPWQGSAHADPPKAPAVPVPSAASPASPAGRPATAGKAEVRLMPKPVPQRPASNPPARPPAAAPTDELRFVPVDVVKRPAGDPLPMKAVR